MVAVIITRFTTNVIAVIVTGLTTHVIAMIVTRFSMVAAAPSV